MGIVNFLVSTNYLKLYWGSQALFYGLVTVVHKIQDSYYDKTRGSKGPNEKIGWFQFRKRVSLVYSFALITTGWMAFNITASYIFGREPGSLFLSVLNVTSEPKTVNTEPIDVLIACTLLQVHLIRRLYESLHVSIQSQRQILNIVEVCVVFVHYPLTMLSLLAEAPTLSDQTDFLHLHHLSALRVSSIILFFGSSYVQYKCHVHMAKLRKNRFGHVTSTDYRMPKGYLYDYASAPHHLAEVLIYLSVGCSMCMANVTWTWLTVFMFCNQYFFARSSHHFYRNKFEDYPKNHKVFIPFIW